jgi:hypothetical protein
MKPLKRKNTQRTAVKIGLRGPSGIWFEVLFVCVLWPIMFAGTSSLSHVNTLLFSPTYTRTEGRAPAWGSEFTTKNATVQGGGGYQNSPLRPNVKFVRLPASVASSPHILKKQNLEKMSDYWRKSPMWLFNAAWRAARGRAPLPQACRHTPAPGRAAGGLRRGVLPQAQAA